MRARRRRSARAAAPRARARRRAPRARVVEPVHAEQVERVRRVGVHRREPARMTCAADARGSASVGERRQRDALGRRELAVDHGRRLRPGRPSRSLSQPVHRFQPTSRAIQPSTSLCGQTPAASDRHRRRLRSRRRPAVHPDTGPRRSARHAEFSAACALAAPAARETSRAIVRGGGSERSAARPRLPCRRRSRRCRARPSARAAARVGVADAVAVVRARVLHQPAAALRPRAAPPPRPGARRARGSSRAAARRARAGARAARARHARCASSTSATVLGDVHVQRPCRARAQRRPPRASVSSETVNDACSPTSAHAPAGAVALDEAPALGEAAPRLVAPAVALGRAVAEHRAHAQPLRRRRRARRASPR